MNWIVASSLMFSFSVAMYLLVRKLQHQQIDNDIVTYALGAMPVVFLGLGALITKTNLSVIPRQLLLLSFMGIVFSYLENKLSLLGIKSAPNPGYSLVIQKSYAPYSALMAAFIFGDSLPTVKLIAILFIVTSIARLLIDDNSQTKESKSITWALQSFGSFFLFGTLVLASRQLLLEGLDPIAIAFYIFLWAAVMFTIKLLRRSKGKKFNKISKSVLTQLLIIGLLNALFNFTMQSAFATAPNVGYVNVINASSIAGITLLSPIFFNRQTSLRPRHHPWPVTTLYRIKHL